MSEKPVLKRREGKKKTSVFMCRKGSHDYEGIGGYEVVDEDRNAVDHAFRWCSTCGALEETILHNGEVKVYIRVPDTGI